MDWKRRKHLIDEIRYSIFNKRMIEVVSVGAVELGDKLIIIKSRYEKKDLPHQLEIRPFIRYNKIQEIGYDYKEILAKNVIFDRDLLGRRGLKALLELSEEGGDGDIQ